jgi:hypothetical protein
MTNDDKIDQILEYVMEIKRNHHYMEEKLDSIMDCIPAIDFQRMQELVNVINEKEEKVQNMYEKLNIMINETKGFLAMERAEFRENSTIIRKFHNGLRKMFESDS